MGGKNSARIDNFAKDSNYSVTTKSQIADSEESESGHGGESTKRIETATLDKNSTQFSEKTPSYNDFSDEPDLCGRTKSMEIIEKSDNHLNITKIDHERVSKIETTPSDHPANSATVADRLGHDSRKEDANLGFKPSINLENTTLKCDLNAAIQPDRSRIETGAVETTQKVDKHIFVDKMRDVEKFQNEAKVELEERMKNAEKLQYEENVELEELKGEKFQNDEKFQPEEMLTKKIVWDVVKIETTEHRLSHHEISLLHRSHHPNPFEILGFHVISRDEDKVLGVVRGWVQGAQMVELLIGDGRGNCSSASGAISMDKIAEWLFECIIEIRKKESTDELDFKYKYISGFGDHERVEYDSYSFGLLLSKYDLELFQSGSFWDVDNCLGSHRLRIEGVEGTRFAVWAPNAKFVSVVGDFNGWDGRPHPMRRRHEFGVWEIFVPKAQVLQKYGFKFHTNRGEDMVKIDPFAQHFENPPAYASIISACDDPFKPPQERFHWTDQDWMDKRSRLAANDELRRSPMSIYEVHLPSWMRGDGNSYLTYREIAPRLVNHIKNLNFTHVEFLPLTHHPFEGSWGYQVTGFYAPYSRLGSADDLKFLINYLHLNHIGVFVDFVPAHFCRDAWALAEYDGECLYEYSNPLEGENNVWGTKFFNYSRSEVKCFLLGAAYHWLRRYHIDGLRIDAVSAMIYKNHCRTHWVPNEEGGTSNIQAIKLLQELNWVVHNYFPGVFMMAEESTSWPGVTDKEHGLGFDAKWDLGWMNDTLSYLCTPHSIRPQKHQKLTFRGLYLGHESWILPLSHDEVVSGKGSLLDKCGFAGTCFHERLKTLRALFGFQIGMPGRPLIFMGAEIAQGREWREQHSVDWHEGTESGRLKNCLFLADLLQIYRTEPALHAGDDESWNFKWTDCNNADDCIVAFIRSYKVWYNDIIVICNFSGRVFYRYPFGVPHGGQWTVLINSDDWKYGGQMAGPGASCKVHTTQGGRLGWTYCLWLDVPASGCVFLKAPSPETFQSLQ